MLALTLSACRPQAEAELRVDGVSPPSVPAGIDSAVRLSGTFEPAVFTDFGNPARSVLGDLFEVRLGETVLPDAKLEADGTLTATVPATVPAGSYLLMVASGDGRSAALATPFAVHGPTVGVRVTLAQATPAEALPFDVQISAVDALGNVVTTFAEPLDLAAMPGDGLSCHAGCISESSLRTTPPQGGTWKGTLSIERPAPAQRITAVGTTASGQSEPFDVRMRTPPEVSRLLLPVVVFPGVGGQVMVDASLARDDFTPPDRLEVSLGIGDDLTGPSAPGSAPWTSYSADRTVVRDTHALAYVRAAVRDGDGDVGFAARHLVTTVDPAELCSVTTSRSKDDGATDCFSNLGLDGELSLPEAIRLANARPGRQVITFSLDAVTANTEIARTSTDPDTLNVTDALWILAPSVAGEVLVISGWNWNLAATDIKLSGFTITWGQNLQGTVTVSAGAQAHLIHTTLRDFVGLVVRGQATLEDVELRRCWSPACIEVEGDGSALTMRGGSLTAGTAVPFFDDGILAEACGTTAAPVVDVSGVVFHGVPQRAIRQGTGCNRSLLVRHGTFHEVGTGVSLGGGSGHVVSRNLFTASGTPVSCGAASFTRRDQNLTYGNATSGCLVGDPGTAEKDPLYLDPVGGADLRLQRMSPAKDASTTVDADLDLNGVAPGTYLGDAPDLGGRETW